MPLPLRLRKRLALAEYSSDSEPEEEEEEAVAGATSLLLEEEREVEAGPSSPSSEGAEAEEEDQTWAKMAEVQEGERSVKGEVETWRLPDLGQIPRTPAFKSPAADSLIEEMIQMLLNLEVGHIPLAPASRSGVAVPLVGDKEAMSVFAAYYQTDNLIIEEKIKLLSEKYEAFRRVKRDGNGFYRSFMFSYLEHILEKQDRVEFQRIMAHIREHQERWNSSLQLGISFKDSCNPREAFEDVPGEVNFRCKYVISGEIRNREEFFKPFISLRPGETMDQFYSSVEQMGQECDHVHIAALSDALHVPIRVEYLHRNLDKDGSSKLNHYDFFPFVGPPQDRNAESCRVDSSSLAASSSSYKSGTIRGDCSERFWTPALNSPENDKTCAFKKSYIPESYTSEIETVENRGFVDTSLPASHLTEIGATGTNDSGRSHVDISMPASHPTEIGSTGTNDSSRSHVPALNAPLSSNTRADESVESNVIALDPPAHSTAENSGLDASIISCPDTQGSAIMSSGRTTNNNLASSPPEGVMNLGDHNIDNLPAPFITLLYRPGHYVILYSK